MATYTPNYNLEKPEASDPFGDFRESYNDNLDIIDANLGGGGGSGGHTIYDENGSAMTQRTGLEFTGNVSVSDDSVNDKTVVDILGGSNLILDAQIYSTEEKQVGVWTDKKPLYQKTIVLNSEITVSNNDWTSTGVTANSLDVETYVRCVAQNSGGTCWDAVNVATIGGYIALTAWRNGDTISVKTFTIQYTKNSDVAGSGGYEAYGFSPVIYSDVERVIGVWRDNKPLYAKTWELTVPNASGAYTFNEATPNLENVAHTEYTLWGLGERGDVPWYNPATILFSEQNDTGIEFYFASNNYAGRKIYFTSFYTKTTDVAGSGDYNTYGVPTVHYSTSEQVIGTWIDGKPLYQTTVHIGNLTFDTNWHNVAHGITNIDKVISCEGILFGVDGEFYPLPNYRSNTNQGIVWGIQGLSSEYVSYINNWYNSTNDAYATLRYTKTTD